MQPTADVLSAHRSRLLAGSLLVLGLWMLGVLMVLPQDTTFRASQGTDPELGNQATRATATMAADARPAPAAAIAAPALPHSDAPAAVSQLQQALQRSSLRGSAVDGTLRLRADGQLHLDSDLVRFFEYHLALLGEFELQDLRALLAEHAAMQLGAEGVPGVLAAFDRYLGLRQALSELSSELSLQQILQARSAIERQWFGDDAEAMFGEARAYDAQTVQRLDADAPSARPGAEGHSMPEREARSGLLAEEQTRQFESLGMTPARRQAERSALWGADAAARLDALDAERAAWEARLQTYALERERLVSSGTATQAQLQALRRRSFDARERLRVEGLERAGAL